MWHEMVFKSWLLMKFVLNPEMKITYANSLTVSIIASSRPTGLMISSDKGFKISWLPPQR
jgi:hypothetical protein